MPAAKRLLLIFAVLAVCVGCDQATKAVAKSSLPQTVAQSYAGDMLRLQLAYNKGAFLSIGASLSSTWRQNIFSIGVGLVLCLLLAYALAAKALRPLEIAALALLIGGGVSNLVDRLLYDGYVVDFINLGIGNVRTGIFNVADLAISSGVCLILFGQLANKPKT